MRDLIKNRVDRTFVVGAKIGLCALFLVAAVLATGCSNNGDHTLLESSGVTTIWSGGEFDEILSMTVLESREALSGDYEYWDGGFLQPISPERILDAVDLLAEKEYVGIEERTASRFVGKRFLDSEELLKRLIDAKEDRIQELKRIESRFAGEGESMAGSIERVREEIRHLVSLKGRLKPYLCRAVAFKNCGTGMFELVTSSRNVGIVYSGLGSGSFGRYNHPVVVFLPFEPEGIAFAVSLAM